MPNLSSNILSMLLASNLPVSGEMLATQYHVSRTAVWKAIKALREQGYPINGSPKIGYSLVANDQLSAEGILHHIHHLSHDSLHIHVYNSIDSTNAQLKRMAGENAPALTVVVANEQTGGHGRYGRSFLSPKDAGLYLSVLLRPDMPASEATHLTTHCAVVAAQAIESQFPPEHEPVLIKWVNDLYLQGKKISGILTEAAMHFENGQLEFAIVGIGINVHPIEWPAELSQKVGDIATITGLSLSRNRLAADIIEGLATFSTDTKDASMNEYRRRSFLIGLDVTVHPAGNQSASGPSYRAHVLDIDQHANLVVKNEFGQTITISSGEVSLEF